MLDSQSTWEDIWNHLGTASRFLAPLGSRGNKAFLCVFQASPLTGSVLQSERSYLPSCNLYVDYSHPPPVSADTNPAQVEACNQNLLKLFNTILLKKEEEVWFLFS